MFTVDREKLGGLVAPVWLTVLAPVITAAIVIGLNVKLLWDFFAAL